MTATSSAGARLSQYVSRVTPTNTAPSRVRGEVKEAKWDEFVLSTCGGHYAQSTAWAKLKEHSEWRAYRVAVERAGVTVAGAQVLVRRMPVIGRIGYAPKGPIVRPGEPGAPALVLKALLEEARRLSLRYLALQPFALDPAFEDVLEGSRRIRPNRDIGTATCTLRIDLSREPDELLAAMSKSTRSKIRRGLSRGITIREGIERDLPSFYRLLSSAAKRKQFAVLPYEHYVRMWRLFAPRHIKLLLAEHEHELVSAMLAVPFGDTVYTHVSAWSGSHAALKPNELIEWKTMMWARSAGYRYYDFEGVDAHIATSAESGGAPENSAKDRMVTSYKLGFGGDVVELPSAYEYIPSSLLDFGYRTIYPHVQRWRTLTRLRKTLTRGLGQP